MVEKIFLRGDGGIVLRRHRLALAGDLGGDALGELAHRLLVNEQGELRLAQHVNEAGCNDQAGGINGALGFYVWRRVPHKDDAIANDAHIGINPGVAAAIHHPAVADQGVEGLLLLGCGQRGENYQSRE